MISNLSISYIIPLHNEQDNVQKIISSVEQLAFTLTQDWEVIIVESGSTDNTWKELEHIIKGRNHFHIFHQEKKEGMGSALRFAYSKATKDIVCHIEGDSPFDLNYFQKALPILSVYDCVIGYRIGKKEQSFRWSYDNQGKKKAFLRAVYHIGYNVLLRIIFGLVVRDVNFSFKLFKRKMIQKLKLHSDGWFIDTEILLELKRMGTLPIEIPIEYQDRTTGQSTINLLSPCHMLYEMFKYFYKWRYCESK